MGGLRLALASLVLFSSSVAAAHVGNIPAPATITSPPRLNWTPVDGGDRAFSQYAFPVADASFDVTWDDGDVDPTGKLFFYYLDHAPPLALSVDDVAKIATPLPETADGIWVSCTCAEDLGVVCPDAGVRTCPNGFTWDTSALAPGAYFIIAITRDPPYDIYTVSEGPIRIAHGGPPAPAMIIVRPDGFGTFDQHYTIRWLLTGQDPHVDLAYASDDDVRAGAPFASLATDVPLTLGSDSTYSFDWDLSALPSAHIYHVRATIRDATGLSTFTESRAGVTVYHPGDDPDLSVPTDLGTKPSGNSGCTMSTGESSSGLIGALMLAAVIGLVLAWRTGRA